MHLDWTADQQKIVDDAESFAASHLAGRALSRFDRDGWQGCARHGILSIPLPLSWGGQDRGALTAVGVMEALGRGGADRGLLFAMGAHLFGCAMPIARFGSDLQQAKWGRGLADGSAIAGLAVTEEHGGSDLSNLRTVAENMVDGYHLRGQKYLITNGPEAAVFLVIAAETATFGAMGTTAFLVARNTPGVVVEPLPQTGLAGAPMAKVMLDCHLPHTAVLGQKHWGLKVFMTAMQWERSCILAGFVGAAQRDLAMCIRYARERHDRGGPLLRHQALAHRIARSQTRLDCARWQIHHAAWRLDRRNDTPASAAQAKLVASEALAACATEVFSLLAGAGWLNRNGVSSSLQDVLGTLSASGTSDVLLNVIAAGMRS